MTTIDKLHLPTEKVTHWRGQVRTRRKHPEQVGIAAHAVAEDQAAGNGEQAPGDKLSLRKLEIVAENSAATVSINRQAAALQRAITKAKAPKNKPPKKR
jgi:hypothetical protein